MSTKPATTQSAAVRRAAQAHVRDLVGRLASAHERLISAVRRHLRKRLPAAHELVYEYPGFLVLSYSPSEHGHQGIFAIRANADGVKLYFNQGKQLPDPDKLLRGSGSQVRWLGLERASNLTQPAVARLMDAAVAANRVAFSATGGGAVILRSAAGKKRRRAAGK